MTRDGLLVIDAQRDYFAGGGLPLVGIEAAADVAAAALGAARAGGRWVGVVEHRSTDPEDGLLVAGTPGAELDPRFLPRDDEDHVVKAAPNAFLDTGLLDLLRTAGVERLTVVGFMSSMCVDATVRAGLDLGLDVEVVAAGCAAPDLRFGGDEVDGRTVHRAFMAALQGAGATVVPSLGESRLQPA